MEKLGKFPIQNCKAPEIKPIAVFQEGNDLVTGDTYCSIKQNFPDLVIGETVGVERERRDKNY